MWLCWMEAGISVGRGEDADATRRLYYVAMTRARRDSHPCVACRGLIQSRTCC